MDSMLAISDEKSDRKPMILETIPELQRLSPRQRLILATELMEDFQEHPTAELDGAIAELIHERRTYYAAHPESARTWEDLKRSIGKA